MSRTFVYIDGLNLYYRALRGTAHKWLNVAALCRATLPQRCDIQRINYYTAHVSGRIDPRSPIRQHAYLRALGTLPNFHIHYGKFLVVPKWSGLIQPAEFRPEAPGPLGFVPIVAYVWKTEEKGSDVNLGVHLVRDALTDKFDEAAVLTNDTDLCDAVRIVVQEANLPVTLLTPVGVPAKSLAALASDVRHIAPYLGPCQFPDPVPRLGKLPVAKPSSW